MLGLSLFNLGAAYNKDRAEEVPRQARQIRKRELEQLKPESQMIAEIAEQEGKTVIEQQQIQQQTQQQISMEALTSSQIAVRAVALTIWTATAGVFFASMIFNTPFGLGKAVLSALPGIPHTTILSLKPLLKYVETGDTAQVEMLLDSNGQSIRFVKADISYDPQLLTFDRFEVDESVFDKVKKIDAKQGAFTLLFERSGNAKEFSDETIARLFFQAKDDDGVATLSLKKDGSLALTPDEDGYSNALGRVESATLRVALPLKIEIPCQPLPSDPNVNKDVFKETLIENVSPNAPSSAVSLDDKRALLCSHYRQNVYLTYSGQQGDVPRFDINNGAIEIKKDQNIMTWQQDGREMTVVSFEKIEQKKTPMVLWLEDDKEYRWPEKGKGELVIK